MGTKTHPKQVRSITGSFPTLYEEVDSVIKDDIENLSEVDIEYTYFADGNVQTESVYDLANPRNLLRLTEFTYNNDGSTNTETVTKGVVKFKKTYVYDTNLLVSKITVRKV